MTTSIAIVDNSDTLENFKLSLAKRELAPTTTYRYTREVKNAAAAGVNLRNANEVAQYASSLPSSRKMFLKAAVKLIATELIETAKANATPDNVDTMQAVMWRAEALTTAIHIKTTSGRKAGVWLNRGEVREMLTACDVETSKGLRDKVLLSLLLGAGLRRDEAAKLEWNDLVELGDRTVIDIVGKGHKQRQVPISKKLVELLDMWAVATGRNGRIVKSVRKGGKIGTGSISGQGINDIVNAYGRKLDKDNLHPHDLRRTYARLGYDAGIDIGQISTLLGHASIKTTQLYLGLEIDLQKTISDVIPL